MCARARVRERGGLVWWGLLVNRTKEDATTPRVEVDHRAMRQGGQTSKPKLHQLLLTQTGAVFSGLPATTHYIIITLVITNKDFL